MVREIIHDPIRLARASAPATQEDLDTARDLADTLRHHADGCVGMAANMIGVHKRIIAFFDGDELRVMFNPEIVSTRNPYETEEGCLSLDGTRPCTRYRRIRVQWQDERFKTRSAVFTDFTAEIIQHEVDHCNGIVI